MFDPDVSEYVFNKIISKNTKLIFKIFYVIIFLLIILLFVGILWTGVSQYIK
jgi:hypothetical protein